MSVRRIFALAVAGTIVLGAAPAAGAVTPTSRNGGGWVATPKRLTSAAVTVQVPTLRCANGKGAGTVHAGLFLATRGGSSLRRWSLDVRASCSAGVARYRAEVLDGWASDSMPVAAGDRVRLIVNGPSDYEIDDLDSGAGMGGGSATSPGSGNATPMLTPRVLLGARVDGTVQRALTVRFTGAVVNKARLRRTAHARITQHKGSTTRVSAGVLASNGSAFRLAVR